MRKDGTRALKGSKVISVLQRTKQEKRERGGEGEAGRRKEVCSRGWRTQGI